MDLTTIIPEGLNVNPGQSVISFNTENGKRIVVRSTVKKEDTDMIQVFTDIDTLVQLTKDIPLYREMD